MIRLEIKISNMLLTENQEKYQHYRMEKYIDVNTLQAKKYCFLAKEKNSTK